jgi:hypothetical protein
MIRRLLERFASFWWDFLVGDDWRIALTVVVALAATYALDQAAIQAWWLVPLAGGAVVVLNLSRR